MGLDYEFQLTFPRAALQDVLLAIADIASPGGNVDVIFPNRTLRLPFGLTNYAKPITCSDATQRLHLNTTLLFTQDAALKRYFEEDVKEGHPPSIDTAGRVAIGYIYLGIDLKLEDEPNLIRFDFQPATSAMSILFVASDSIRQTFTQLLEAHNGVLGNFHDTDYHWGPITFWPPTSPRYDPTNLLVLHNRLSPNELYYRMTSDKLYPEGIVE